LASTIAAQDSWGVKDNSQTSLAASPRQKTTQKQANAANRFSIILHFVKTNLKLLLRLVSTDIHN
jgi:hypothetical protein